MYYFIFFSVLIIILINIPFIIEFKISRKHEDDNIHIYLKLTDNIKIIQLEVPYMDIILSNNDININMTRDIETKKKSIDKKNKMFSSRHAAKLLKRLYENEMIFNGIKSFNNYITRKIKIDNFQWETKIGYQDAAACAILSGIMWNVKSLIFSYIDLKYRLINFHYDVNTIYNNNVFEIDLDFKLKVRVIHIIQGVLFSLLSILKGGELNV